MREIFNSFIKSLDRLKEVLEMKKTAVSRDAAIQRFEFTAELAWKLIQVFLRDQKIICRSPRECLQEAFKFGLIKDDPRWIKAFEDRNLTAHTYNEKVADKVYNRLPRYLKNFNLLKEKFIKKTKK